MDKSDKKWIDENVMNSNLISYQWSIKLETGEIYMVQANTIEEFDLKIKDIKTKFLNSRTIPEAPVSEFAPPFAPAATFTPSPTTQATASPSVVCNTCGAKAFINSGVSKTGNPYKIQKCSKFPELQKLGGHSFWMK